MKLILSLLVLCSCLTSYSQSRSEINRLNSESKIIGEIAYPMLYRFKTNELILNGAGIKKAFGYSCALYLERPETNSETIIDKDETMIMRMNLLSKKTSRKKMVEVFKENLTEANTVTFIQELGPEIELFLEYVEELYLHIGDTLDVVYEPYKGTSIYVNYEKKGTISGFDFKKAIFNVWLSQKPIDKDLKVELLDGAKGYAFY